MALLSTLVKAVADVEGLDETQVSWIARHLREAGLITQAGRGRGAAHMTSDDATNLLIGVNASSSAKDAVETVKKFHGLKLERNSPLAEEAQKEALWKEYDALNSDFQMGSCLKNSIRGLIESHLSMSVEHKQIDSRFFVMVRFRRPVIGCSILVNHEDKSGSRDYVDAIFDTPGRDKHIVPPDRTDETVITSRTFEAIAKALQS